MFGGVGTVWGPIIGAAFLIPVGEILHAEFGARFPGIQGVIFGVAIIVVILLAPEGVFWRVRDWLRVRHWWRARPGGASPPASAPAAAHAKPTHANVVSFARLRPVSDEVILEVRHLSKSFGGLKAVHDVSFKVRRGMLLGIIGPNGAGKTTLFNLLNGFLTPDRGEVLLRGVDMVGKAAARAVPSWCRPHLPDHAAVPPHERRRQRQGRRLCARRQRGGGRAPGSGGHRAASAFRPSRTGRLPPSPPRSCA